MSAVRHVVVVGAGIAGLTTAYTLQEKAREAALPLSFTLLESDRRLGGKIVTERTPEGFVIEGGPDSLLAQKPWATELCRRLGLGGDLIGTNDEQRRTYVARRGQLVALPDGMRLVVPTRIAPVLTSPLLSWRGKARMAMDLVVRPRRDTADESVGSFVRRRFGREVLDTLGEPLMAGIHVADPEALSLLATFPRLRDLERKWGSLIRGTRAQERPERAGAAAGRASPAAFLTLRHGLGQLVEALERALDGGRVVAGSPAVALERGDGGDYRVRSASGATFEADALVLALPAYVSAALLERLAPALAAALAEIRYVSSATVSLGFRRRDVPHPLDGFGFVTPGRERRRILACTWTSTKFEHRAPPGTALLRCFVGGWAHEELVDLSDGALVALVREELASLMGISAAPIATRLYRWHKGNPQYDVGHLERVRSIFALAEAEPGLFLTGSGFEGVGVPDCVRQAQETAEKVLAHLFPAREAVRIATRAG